MKFKSPNKPGNEENLIPLINIVFLILIFFIVAGTIRPFSSKDIKIPISDATEKYQTKTLKIKIRKGGEISLNGQESAKQDLLIELKNYKASSKDIQVSVIPDQNLEAGKLIEILELIKQAELPSVSLITVRGVK